jgi:tetratricopeptide (TPR) repeat protein
MEWLLSEDKTPRNLLRRGVELEHLEEYAEAASKYEEFLLLARDAFDMDTINSVRHSVGFCRFRLGKYEEAITSFEACSVTPETNVELYPSSTVQAYKRGVIARFWRLIKVDVFAGCAV